MEHQDWDPVVLYKKPTLPANKHASSAKSDEELGPPPTISVDHRKRIFNARIQARMSQEKFAKALSISPKLIKEWEQGKGKPNPQQLQKIHQKFKF